MKPLQKILAIKSISSNLIDRGFSWDDVYSYLREYNSSAYYYRNEEWDSLEQYISNQVAFLSDADVASIYEELLGKSITDEVIPDSETIWKSGYYRLFISHLTKDKQSVAYLKKCLASYGIDCFVAHEDIEPTKEWIKDIRHALMSTHCLCAVFSPGFCESKWCDQEVGTALGRQIPTISISKGADPHGFLSEFQAIKARDTANEVADSVFKALCLMDDVRQKYYPIISRLFLESENEQEAIHWIDVIVQANSFPDSQIALIYEGYKSNPALGTEKVIPKLNVLFKRINRRASKSILIDESDLPF